MSRPEPRKASLGHDVAAVLKAGQDAATAAARPRQSKHAASPVGQKEVVRAIDHQLGQLRAALLTKPGTTAPARPQHLDTHGAKPSTEWKTQLGATSIAETRTNLNDAIAAYREAATPRKQKLLVLALSDARVAHERAGVKPAEQKEYKALAARANALLVATLPPLPPQPVLRAVDETSMLPIDLGRTGLQGPFSHMGLGGYDNEVARDVAASLGMKTYAFAGHTYAAPANTPEGAEQLAKLNFAQDPLGQFRGNNSDHGALLPIPAGASPEFVAAYKKFCDAYAREAIVTALGSAIYPLSGLQAAARLPTSAARPPRLEVFNGAPTQVKATGTNAADLPVQALHPPSETWRTVDTAATPVGEPASTPLVLEARPAAPKRPLASQPLAAPKLNRPGDTQMAYRPGPNDPTLRTQRAFWPVVEKWVLDFKNDHRFFEHGQWKPPASIEEANAYFDAHPDAVRPGPQTPGKARWISDLKLDVRKPFASANGVAAHFERLIGDYAATVHNAAKGPLEMGTYIMADHYPSGKVRHHMTMPYSTVVPEGGHWEAGEFTPRSFNRQPSSKQPEVPHRRELVGVIHSHPPEPLDSAWASSLKGRDAALLKVFRDRFSWADVGGYLQRVQETQNPDYASYLVTPGTRSVLKLSLSEQGRREFFSLSRNYRSDSKEPQVDARRIVASNPAWFKITALTRDAAGKQIEVPAHEALALSQDPAIRALGKEGTPPPNALELIEYGLTGRVTSPQIDLFQRPRASWNEQRWQSPSAAEPAPELKRVLSALAQVNPAWSHASASTSNCWKCVMAVSDLVAGRPFVAPPAATQAERSVNITRELETHFSSQFEALPKKLALAQAVREVHGAGPGAQAIVRVRLEHGYLHFFNIANIDGQVQLLDGQSNRSRTVTAMHIADDPSALREILSDQIELSADDGHGWARDIRAHGAAGRTVDADETLMDGIIEIDRMPVTNRQRVPASSPDSPWSDYFKSILQAPPDPHLVKFLNEHYAKPGRAPGVAVDLGSGAGQQSALLASHGWDVLAIDADPASRHFVEQTVQRRRDADITTGREPGSFGKVVTLQRRFQDTPLPKGVDLVWSSASLPYLPLNELPGVIDKVHTALAPGGHFVTTFFGPDHVLKGDPGKLFMNVPEIRSLLRAFEIKSLERGQVKGKLPDGTDVLLDLIKVVARKAGVPHLGGSTPSAPFATQSNDGRLHAGIPSEFWQTGSDPAKYAQRYSLSTPQIDALRALAPDRDLLRGLPTHRFATQDEAISAVYGLIERARQRNPRIERSLELGGVIYEDQGTWRASLPVLGEANRVDPGLLPQKGQTRGNFLYFHVHPPADLFARTAVGFSLDDLVYAMESNSGALVSRRGRVYRLDLAASWREKEADARWQDINTIRSRLLLLKTPGLTEPDRLQVLAALRKDVAQLPFSVSQYERTGTNTMAGKRVDVQPVNVWIPRVGSVAVSDPARLGRPMPLPAYDLSRLAQPQ